MIKEHSSAHFDDHNDGEANKSPEEFHLRGSEPRVTFKNCLLLKLNGLQIGDRFRLITISQDDNCLAVIQNLIDE